MTTKTQIGKYIVHNGYLYWSYDSDINKLNMSLFTITSE